MSSPEPVPSSPPVGASAGAVPRHVALIMDGNGRWAHARGLPRWIGHREGARRAEQTVEQLARKGVEFVTLFAFSSENWSRPKQEVAALMKLLERSFLRDRDRLARNGIRFRLLGDRARLPAKLCELLTETEEGTKHESRVQLLLALSYGGRDEIALAAQHAARAVRDGVLSLDALSAREFAAFLSAPDVPDPDLLIRTGGEKRISNFLLWQLAYTELLFLDCWWPDFGADVLDRALEEFGRRQRRYGSL